MSDTDQLDLVALAERLIHDYDDRNPGTVFAEGLRLSLDDAWRVQHAVTRLREQRGEEVVGYKIGCVCEANQKKLGVPHPVWGRLWSTEQHADGATLSKGDFSNVAIEGEFAVTLKQDLAPGVVSTETIADAVDTILPVIELHNLTFRGADPKGHELIANNAIHAGVVRGRGCLAVDAPRKTDLRITFDGEEVDQWQAIQWPQDILRSISWLSEQLDANGLRMRRGHTILTSALGPPLPVTNVKHVKVTSAIFGDVEATFS